MRCHLSIKQQISSPSIPNLLLVTHLFPSLQLTLITVLHVHYIFTKNFSDNLLSTYSFLSAPNINLDTLYMCSAIPSRLNLVDMAVHVQTRVLRIGFFEDPPTDPDGRVIQSEA